MRLECDARFTLKACTDAFTGAEELTVEVFRSQFRGSGNSNKVLKLFEGIRGVRKARIFGHGIEEWPEYIRLLEMSMMSLPGTNLLAEERRKGVIDDKLGNIVSVWDATGLLAMPA